MRSRHATTQTSEADGETIAVRASLLEELVDLSSSLGGEEAVNELIRFIDYPQDSSAGDYALKAVVRFYSNVSYLMEQIRQAAKP